MSLFKLRGELSQSQRWIWGIVGFVFLVLLWWILAEMRSVQVPINYTQREYPSSIGADSITLAKIDSLARLDSIDYANASEFEKVYPIIPSPVDVVYAFPEMLQEDELIRNTLISTWRNIQGYLWAIILAIPIGFLIGLFPIFKGMFSRPIDALRFLPLTALTGAFMLAFGIGEQMKINFLAFGIIVYLLPIVVQRLKEVKEVYLRTTFTLGATDWQTIKTVYIPSVMSKLIDDIRVLTAISWTYIIIAELLNEQDGIGTLMYKSGRQGHTEKVFAGLIVIIIVGFLQDWIFGYLEKRLFPHKQYSRSFLGFKEAKFGIYAILGVTVLLVMVSSFIPT
ncbi:MAG: ABC transporter permease subunit, partial [Bacteroidota bacterium]